MPANKSIVAPSVLEDLDSKADVKFFSDKDKCIHVVISPLDNVVGKLSSTGKTNVVAYGSVEVNGVRISVTATRKVDSSITLPEYGYTDKEDRATLR